MTEYLVTVLHDFYVDRLVFPGDIGRLLASIRDKGAQGGGGIHDIDQRDARGGNAVNLAYALARLGTSTYLITHSDEIHEGLLRRDFKGLKAKLSVKDLEPGLTVALEGVEGSRRLNVMLSHLGGAGRFHPSLLNAEDWETMKASRIVCNVNWSANAHGVELLREIRRKIGRKTIFLDPADFRDRIERYRQLLEAMKRERIVDWLSTNEFEGRATAKLLGVEAERLDIVCRNVASDLSVRFDLHTEAGSFTSDGGEVHFHRVKKLVPLVLTGSGDVWDAASIHFYLKGMADVDRIALADTAAGLHLRSTRRQAPSEREVLSLFKHS